MNDWVIGPHGDGMDVLPLAPEGILSIQYCVLLQWNCSYDHQISPRIDLLISCAFE